MAGIWLGTRFWCGRYLDVDNVIVDPQYRGVGIGQQLMDWVENYAHKGRGSPGTMPLISEQLQGSHCNCPSKYPPDILGNIFLEATTLLWVIKTVRQCVGQEGCQLAVVRAKRITARSLRS
ncbi:GNAT family N-acetyltransferase [Acidithiobacillus ferridurans]|nr:GNAT family N-acetyltransferase [Acidithiobacillus ferridurans]